LKGEDYNEKVDVWALGINIFVLLSGYPPFTGETAEEMITNIKESNIDFNPEAWEKVSSDATNFIVKCLDSENRPSI